MADVQQEAGKTEASPVGKPIGEFLASTPPDVVEQICDLGRYYSPQRQDLIYLNTPDLLLYCDSEQCQGGRFFHCTEGKEVNITGNN